MKTFEEFLTEKSLMGKPIMRENKHCETLATFAYKDQLTSIQDAYEAGCDLDSKDSDNFTALIRASQMGHIRIVKWLLEHGANPNVVGGSTDATALGIIFSTNPTSTTYDIAELLLDFGADVNYPNRHGFTPTMAIANNFAYEMHEPFKKHGADPYLRNNSGSSSFDIADRMNNKEFINFFMKKD